MNKELPIISEIKRKYPFAEIYAYENDNQIYISQIRIPEEQRGQGIGKDIIEMIKKYASEIQKPVVLSPESEKGYKKKLEKFYKNLGFVHNKGRNKDYHLSKPFAATMFWRPMKFSEYVQNRDANKNL